MIFRFTRWGVPPNSYVYPNPVIVPFQLGTGLRARHFTNLDGLKEDLSSAGNAQGERFLERHAQN